MRRVSVVSLFFMCKTSTMFKSSGWSTLFMQRTASTATSAMGSARLGAILVLSDVLATQTSFSRSFKAFGTGTLNSSRNLIASSLARSKPSAMSLGCKPSARHCSASFMSSPMNITLDVVPSPVISSCAVAALAIMLAVGCWICISLKSTTPSFVILICPAPPTNIFSVPLGPKFVLMTSCKPLAAFKLTAKACDAFKTSAFELTTVTMMDYVPQLLRRCCGAASERRPRGRLR
mmetsp:Transcript_155807/g.499496  ORF Transcript_155807/g.499496 Transcript_155807/m.499496 type:complete len:234 (-) Transcript_155807:40-741(-)